MTPTPKEIRKIGDVAMRILWSDGKNVRYDAPFLRDNCHCAACRHELTGERLLPEGSVPPDLKILKSEILGNYALGFQFSDGHSTGIYSFDMLYKFGEALANQSS